MSGARWSILLLVPSLCAAAGCGDPPKKEPPPEKQMLDKLDSDDPDTFLEGVDEAGKKYGKQS
jgi:hypothetical protein